MYTLSLTEFGYTCTLSYMDIKDIRVGSILRLKRERREAYGLSFTHVRVESIKQREGYKSFWVIARPVKGTPFADGGFFKASDFEREINEAGVFGD